MCKATLIIMAAGIGSRFGEGIKQLTPIGPNGEILIDYAVYDAVKAGFDKVICVIRKDLEKDFKDIIGKRIEKMVRVEYAYQEVGDIPSYFSNKFSKRIKPWGTGQAVLCCRRLVDSPFLVINADDYYGREAYQKAYHFLVQNKSENHMSACMVGFVLKNTLSKNGGVTRGICNVDKRGLLQNIVETHNIQMKNSCEYSADDNEKVDLDSVVSMNMWGLYPEFMEILEKRFINFLENTTADDLNKEFLMPVIIGELLQEKSIEVKVLHSNEKWFGVTYQADKENVMNEMGKLINSKVYPRVLSER